MRIKSTATNGGVDKYDGGPYWVYTYELWLTDDEAKEWKEKANKYIAKHKKDFPYGVEHVRDLKQVIKKHFTLDLSDWSWMCNIGYEDGISLVDLMLSQDRSKW